MRSVLFVKSAGLGLLLGFIAAQAAMAQSLDIPQFTKMMKELEPYIELWKSSRGKEAAAVAG